MLLGQLVAISVASNLCYPFGGQSLYPCVRYTTRQQCPGLPPSCPIFSSCMHFLSSPSSQKRHHHHHPRQFPGGFQPNTSVRSLSPFPCTSVRVLCCLLFFLPARQLFLVPRI